MGRRGRDRQPGWRGLKARQWLEDWAVPHSHADKPGGTTREWDRPQNLGFQHREIKPQSLTEKTCKGWGSSRRNSQSHRQVHCRDPQGLTTYTNPPTQESAPERPNLPVGSQGSDWKPAKSRASSIVPSWTPPPHTAQHSEVGCPALVNT